MQTIQKEAHLVKPLMQVNQVVSLWRLDIYSAATPNVNLLCMTTGICIKGPI